MRNKKGFTLVEILIVMMLLAVLGLAAISTYFGSTSTFAFIMNYKSAIGSIRTARSYAITNRSGEDVDRYGIEIAETTGGDFTVKIFEDDRVRPLEFSANDRIVFEKTFNNPYIITPVTPSVSLPIYFYYETDSGSFSAYYGTTAPFAEISKDQYKFIALKFTDGELEKYIAFIQVSGLVEQLIALP